MIFYINLIKMKNRNILFLLAVIALFGVVFISCDKDDDTEGDYNSSMTCVIDGTPFTASDFAFLIVSDSITSVVGWNENQYVRFKILNADTLGSYQVANKGLTLGLYSVDGQINYHVARDGWVTFTENSEDRIAGSFWFVFDLRGGPPDSIYIGDGLFDVSKMEKFSN